MPFIPHTESDIDAMLARIGIAKIDDVFSEIPEKIAHANISAMPKGMSEAEVVRLSAERAPIARLGACFIGAGAYDHYIPAAVWDIVTRGEFYTAYTPYQPEASQGTLEVIYDYQTLMTELMAMEVSNASLYDGASALAEAILMAARITNKDTVRVLIPDNLHPHYRETIQSIIKPTTADFIAWHYNAKTGCNDVEQFKKETVDIVVIAQPNFFGGIEAVDMITTIAHEKKALVIGVVNPIAMAMLKPPGQWGDTGADIACGEGQPLGVPLMGGGPYFGFLCCRKKDIRQLPGRIVGKTVDKEGKPGYVLTLQAREQHIRRAKATSNICTNQGLLMTAATIYMRLLGGKGLEIVAKQCYENAEKLKKLLLTQGVDVHFSGHTFHEFVVTFNQPIENVMAAFEAIGIQPGLSLEKYYPELKNALLICVTETKTDKDLEKFTAIAKEPSCVQPL